MARPVGKTAAQRAVLTPGDPIDWSTFGAGPPAGGRRRRSRTRTARQVGAKGPARRTPRKGACGGKLAKTATNPQAIRQNSAKQDQASRGSTGPDVRGPQAAHGRTRPGHQIPGRAGPARARAGSNPHHPLNTARTDPAPQRARARAHPCARWHTRSQVAASARTCMHTRARAGAQMQTRTHRDTRTRARARIHADAHACTCTRARTILPSPLSLSLTHTHTKKKKKRVCSLARASKHQASN